MPFGEPIPVNKERSTSSCGYDPVDQILLALASPSSTPSTSASISIEVSGLAAGDSLSIYNSKDCSGTAVATTASNSSVTVNGLSEGAHVFHFKITEFFSLQLFQKLSVLSL